MRWYLWLPVALSLAALSAARGQGPAGAGADRAALQGTWVCVTAQDAGKAAPQFLGIRAVVDGDRITWHYPRDKGAYYLVKSATYRIDAAARPGHFDITYPDNPSAVDRRLYTVAADELRWSANLDRKTAMTRPASFEAGRYQFTMRRAKEAPMLGTAIDPGDDCTLQLYPNRLRIQVPAGDHDLWYGSRRFNAPRMVRAVRGDFVAQVKVTADDWSLGPKLADGRSSNGAGLLVWDSPKQYLRLDRTQFYLAKLDAPYWFTTPLYDVNDQRVNPVKGTADNFFKGRSTWFRLQRAGQTITTWVSHDGSAWTETGRLTSQFPDRVQVGVHALNGSQRAFTVDFEDFTVRTN